MLRARAWCQLEKSLHFQGWRPVVPTRRRCACGTSGPSCCLLTSFMWLRSFASGLGLKFLLEEPSCQEAKGRSTAQHGLAFRKSDGTSSQPCSHTRCRELLRKSTARDQAPASTSTTTTLQGTTTSMHDGCIYGLPCTSRFMNAMLVQIWTYWCILACWYSIGDIMCVVGTIQCSSPKAQDARECMF